MIRLKWVKVVRADGRLEAYRIFRLPFSDNQYQAFHTRLSVATMTANHGFPYAIVREKPAPVAEFKPWDKRGAH
jgi:hypothetical protein